MKPENWKAVEKFSVLLEMQLREPSWKVVKVWIFLLGILIAKDKFDLLFNASVKDFRFLCCKQVSDLLESKQSRESSEDINLLFNTFCFASLHWSNVWKVTCLYGRSLTVKSCQFSGNLILLPSGLASPTDQPTDGEGHRDAYASKN